MSRVSRRTGTKSLVCPQCVKAVKSKPGISPRDVGSFRGKGRARLEKHIQEVHINPRTVKPRIEE